jgi:hypothetical protein
MKVPVACHGIVAVKNICNGAFFCERECGPCSCDPVHLLRFVMGPDLR